LAANFEQSLAIAVVIGEVEFTLEEKRTASHSGGIEFGVQIYKRREVTALTKIIPYYHPLIGPG
jgi:hypothetical protein